MTSLKQDQETGEYKVLNGSHSKLKDNKGPQELGDLLLELECAKN